MGHGVDCGLMRVEQIQLESPRYDWSQSAVLGQRGTAARNFADLVAARLVGTVLPFNERESLVRTAARYGIARFEANLIIAAVQHQLGVGRQREKRKRLPRRMRFAPAVAAVVALQAGIVAAVWYLLF